METTEPDLVDATGERWRRLNVIYVGGAPARYVRMSTEKSQNPIVGTRRDIEKSFGPVREA